MKKFLKPVLLVLLLSVSTTTATVFAAPTNNLSTNKQVTKLSTSLSSITLLINGTKSKLQAFEEKDTLYLPIEPIVKAMGGTYSWNEPTSTGTAKTKDGKTIVLGFAKTVATVNGKEVPLSTVKNGNSVVPAGARTKIIDEDMYVPSQFVNDVLGYPVTKKDVNLKTTVYVGVVKDEVVKEDEKVVPYAPPKGWIAPTIKSSPLPQVEKNGKILEDELGFVNMGAGAFYNPFNKNKSFSTIQVALDPRQSYEAKIWIHSWENEIQPEYNKTPFIAKELFKFYLKNDSSSLYNIVKKSYDHNEDHRK